jgi:SH3 domain protein
MMVCLFVQFCHAQTGYVSDMLLLTFRQGPGDTYAVLKTLKSDTPVSIIEEENGYYKVELQSEETGWVDKKFIVFETPKAFIIDRLTRENERLENKISTLESFGQTLKESSLSQQNEYSQKIESLEASLKTALDEKVKLENLLADHKEKYNTLIEQSKNIQKIVKENKILQENSTTLSREFEILKQKNGNQFKTGMIKWFLAGVGVLLLGWIIGQSVSTNKRRSGSLLD